MTRDHPLIVKVLKLDPSAATLHVYRIVESAISNDKSNSIAIGIVSHPTVDESVVKSAEKEVLSSGCSLGLSSSVSTSLPPDNDDNSGRFSEPLLGKDNT